MLNNNKKKTHRFNTVNSLGINTHIVICVTDETAHFACKKLLFKFPFMYLFIYFYVCTYM